MSSSPSWVCPSCFKRCPYGSHGCGSPETCEEPKNNNYLHRKEHKPTGEANGIGISEIAVDNSEKP